MTLIVVVSLQVVLDRMERVHHRHILAPVHAIAACEHIVIQPHPPPPQFAYQPCPQHHLPTTTAITHGGGGFGGGRGRVGGSSGDFRTSVCVSVLCSTHTIYFCAQTIDNKQ